YHGVIHRDLKPSNIMVSPTGGAKLMDFGIARPADASFHTVDGTILGTLQYLSPEQLEGAQLDIRTDLYSLGVCLYEMACGHIAFPESNITRLLSDKIKNKYKPLSEFDVNIPEQYITLIHKLMHHDKKLRVQNATVLIELLSNIYYQHTQDTPEQTVAQFMQTDIETRNSPEIFDKSPLRKYYKPLYIIIPLLIVIVSILIFFVFKPLFHHQTSKKATRQTLEYPQIPVNTGDSLTTNHNTPTKDSTPITPQTLQSSKTPDTTNHPVNKTKDKSTGSEMSQKDPVPKNPSAALIDRLSRKYNTSNLLEIIAQELSAARYSNVLKLIDELSETEAKSTKAVIFKLRALKNTNRSEYVSFISTIKTQEAEILLNKASIACDKKRTGDALITLENAEKAPAELLTYDQVNRELIYLKAVCITQLFDKGPDEAHWKASIGAWYQVKKNLRTDQSHAYYVTADKEIARIGEKYRSLAK
ncbi:MAG: serine/threonine protein kinase, partial [Fibrobacter sp.]|nr:serine/threonine protein kinase [Fibrobacter sp.]